MQTILLVCLTEMTSISITIGETFNEFTITASGLVNSTTSTIGNSQDNTYDTTTPIGSASSTTVEVANQTVPLGDKTDSTVFPDAAETIHAMNTGVKLGASIGFMATVVLIVGYYICVKKWLSRRI